MAKKVHVGQLWRGQRGVVWQVSALYRPVVGSIELEAVEFADGSREVVESAPVYGEQHAILYQDSRRGVRNECHIAVSRLVDARWHWKPVE